MVKLHFFRLNSKELCPFFKALLFHQSFDSISKLAGPELAQCFSMIDPSNAFYNFVKAHAEMRLLVIGTSSISLKSDKQLVRKNGVEDDSQDQPRLTNFFLNSFIQTRRCFWHRVLAQKFNLHLLARFIGVARNYPLFRSL